MSDVKRWVVVLSAIWVIVASKTCWGLTDGDFQWWTSASASFKVTEELKGEFCEELRFGEDGKRLYYEHSDLGITYTGLADWIDVSANFRLVYAKVKDNWLREDRPHVNATLKERMFSCGVSNRMRLEYRDLPTTRDVWRYRNKSQVELPFGLTALKLRPYVSDEIFLPLNGDGIDQNWLSGGFTCELFTNLKAEIYYRWISARVCDEWIQGHVLGAALKFKF